MDVKIASTKENKIMGRTEIDAIVAFEKSTPTRKDIKGAVCAKIGANPDSVTLREVTSKFGNRSVSVALHVYASKENALSKEPNHILARDGLAQKKPKKEKKKAAPAAKKK